MVYDYFTNDHLPYGTDLLVGGQVGWGPVGHAVVTKLLAKSAGALKISVISEERENMGKPWENMEKNMGKRWKQMGIT